jgi:hypothetical protein
MGRNFTQGDDLSAPLLTHAIKHQLIFNVHYSNEMKFLDSSPKNFALMSFSLLGQTFIEGVSKDDDESTLSVHIHIKSHKASIPGSNFRMIKQPRL